MSIGDESVAGAPTRPSDGGGPLTWPEVARSFRVLSARDVLGLSRLERHQDLRHVRWLGEEARPVALLFISHRWETLAHPDPAGHQLAALQAFLRDVCRCLEAALLPRDGRLALVATLEREGVLQAAEVARRALGFGPFSGASAAPGGPAVRSLASSALRNLGPEAFRRWLEERVAVWVDYSCMPQRPFAPDDLPAFRRALGQLDALVGSSNLIALRQAGDDYPRRAWCASEFFLASGRSFARGIAIDAERLAAAAKPALPPRPCSSDPAAAAVMTEAYEDDLRAYRDACDAWLATPAAVGEVGLPDAWGSYRSLQGSAFLPSDGDPNPFRCVLDMLGVLETALVTRWLMSDRPLTVDVGAAVDAAARRAGLACSEPGDLPYLGLLLACHGWIDAFRPLLRACLSRWVEHAARGGAVSPTLLRVRLEPPREDVRALLRRVRPSTTGTWRSRLAESPGTSGRGEAAVVAQVRAALETSPLRFALLSAEEAVAAAAEDLLASGGAPDALP
jgi:hypothetical protein